jgi:hypothetical protein
VFGGLNDTTFFGDLWLFDLTTADWAQLLLSTNGDDVVVRAEHTLVVFNRSLIVYGGTSLDLARVSDQTLVQIVPGCNPGSFFVLYF